MSDEIVDKVDAVVAALLAAVRDAMDEPAYPLALVEKLNAIEASFSKPDMIATILKLRGELAEAHACLTVRNGGPYQIVGDCVHVLDTEYEAVIAERDSLRVELERARGATS